MDGIDIKSAAKEGVLEGDVYKKHKELPKEVSFLELTAMNVFLEKLNTAVELDPVAKNWREDVIDMFYDIEDYIDDFMDQPETLKDIYHLVNHFQKISVLVIKASEHRMSYNLDERISNTTHVVVDPCLLACYNEPKSIVGIDRQKENLVNWVMDKEQQLQVISITGFGGARRTQNSRPSCLFLATHLSGRLPLCAPNDIRAVGRALSSLHFRFYPIWTKQLNVYNN